MTSLSVSKLKNSYSQNVNFWAGWPRVTVKFGLFLAFIYYSWNFHADPLPLGLMNFLMSARGLKDDKSTVLICIRSCLKYKWPWKVGHFWEVNKYLSISQLFYGILLIITQFWLKFINVNFVVFRRLTMVNRGSAWFFGC